MSEFAFIRFRLICFPLCLSILKTQETKTAQEPGNVFMLINMPLLPTIQTYTQNIRTATSAALKATLVTSPAMSVMSGQSPSVAW